MAQYGYNSGNASTFNQLVRTGVTVEEASKQSGVSTNAGQYGYGTNNNLASIIPGAGGTSDVSGITQVPYAQTATGAPEQQAAQISNASTINANTSGLPIFNEEGQAVQGIRRNPETGETYYTATTTPTTTNAPADVVQNAAGVSVGSINSVQDPQQRAESAAAITSASSAYTGKLLAQRQQVLETQSKSVNNSDWRLRLSLAPGADYLYNATPNGILWPLKQTGGVIFPYTPKITTNYTANYTTADLTHSNYRNYFYQNSNVGEISIDGKFTAQDTNEAQYLLAVIHFFRSVTRMFYGQDAQRGAPPPLVFLTGFGEYQFNQHPCVVSSFTYSMPENVDYIRARSVNVNGANLLTRRTRQSAPTDPVSGAVQRISNLFTSQGISPGAVLNRPAPPTLGQNNPTYVPTMVDLSLKLLPVQSRRQVSQQFSVKGFANGDLIKGGFW
jgi:hypothetical protein